MSIFDQLTQAAADYDTLCGAFRESKQTVSDVAAAVAARLADERARMDEKAAALTAQSQDPAWPEIVRKLAARELERIRELAFVPSEDEAAAFSAALEDARAALRAAAAVKVKLAELFREADQELKAMRVGTLGNQALDTELAERHLDGEQKSFDRLGHTGRRNGRP